MEKLTPAQLKDLMAEQTFYSMNLGLTLSFVRDINPRLYQEITWVMLTAKSYLEDGITLSDVQNIIRAGVEG